MDVDTIVFREGLITAWCGCVHKVIYGARKVLFRKNGRYTENAKCKDKNGQWQE